MPGPAPLLPLLVAGAFALQPPGQFHGGEPVARDGERWLALHVDAGAARLAESVLRVEPVEDLLLDAPGERSGRQVSSADGDHVLAYLRGTPLRAGAVPMAAFASDASLSQAPATFTFAGRAWRLAAECDPPAGPPPEAGQPALACRLVLDDGAQRQVLASMTGYIDADGHRGLGDDAAPALLFAGDLDRDGRPDLILDATDHYNVSRPTLFLSSQARAGEFVRQVARYQSVGC